MKLRLVLGEDELIVPHDIRDRIHVPSSGTLCSQGPGILLGIEQIFKDRSRRAQAQQMPGPREPPSPSACFPSAVAKGSWEQEPYQAGPRAAAKSNPRPALPRLHPHVYTCCTGVAHAGSLSP